MESLLIICLMGTSDIFRSLLDEMKLVLREAMERKTENNARRKRRKDLLRLQIIRVLQVCA